MAIENKIYSGEGRNQTQRYFEAINSYGGYTGFGVLLTVASKEAGCDKFVNITYQELLTYVIEPLVSSVSPDSLKFVESFIRNLGRPALTDNKCYGVLAVSQKEKSMLQRVVENNRDIFDTAFASLYNLADVKKVVDEGSQITEISDDELDILRMLWDANEVVFKAVLYHLYGEQHKTMLDKLFKSTNRDTSKYVVSHNGTPLFEGKRLSKAMTACAIFNAYLKENPLTTLEELRKAFPCEKLNDYYYNRKFNELFYEFNCDGYILFTAGKHEGEKTLAQWDFYVDDEKLLPIENGQKKAMCVKMWRKGDFDKLIELVNNKKKYNFITIEER